MTADTLAATLGGTVDPNYGDARVIVNGDLIYAAPTGRVRVQHRDHVHTLGTCADPDEVIVTAYRALIAA